MANYLLKPVFRDIFNREINASQFNDRLEMQKMVYLLQNLGVSIGDYNFLWYKHGPYSQVLQNDILNISSTENIDIQFSIDAKRTINLLKRHINTSGLNYTQYDWLECLGSILYIKDNFLSTNSTKNKVLSELVKRKPHLNNQTDNDKAYDVINYLYFNVNKR